MDREPHYIRFSSLALHLASAEAAEVDAFLTCDDRLLKRAKRYSKQLNILNRGRMIILDRDVLFEGNVQAVEARGKLATTWAKLRL